MRVPPTPTAASAGAALLLLLAVAAASAQPAHLDEWTTARSDHFEVHSDAGAERATEVALTLERFRAAFAELAPDLSLRSPAPTRIFAFRDADSYRPYRTVPDRDGVKILGQFLSHRDGNYITVNADPGYVGAFAVIYHEYVHYLVQHNLPGAPAWFNEGLAEYYSSFAVEGESAVIGRPVDRHLRWLARHAELSLREVLTPASGGAAHDSRGAGHFYAVSWALVHYLLSSQPASRVAELLTSPEEPERAFERVIGLRLEKLEKELEGYVRQVRFAVAELPIERLPDPAGLAARPARPAEVLAALGDLLAHSGREEGAESHYRLALEYEPESAEALAGLGFVRDLQGRLAEAEEYFRQALAAGPESALSYLLYGRHLVALAQEGGPAGESAELEALARRAGDAFAAALVLEPDYGEALAMLGFCHLLPGLDPAEGIAPLERASELLPGRADILLHLAQLYLRAERPEAARALVEGALAQVGGPEARERGREEIERWGLIRAANLAFREGDMESGLRFFDQAVSATSDPELRARMEEQLLDLRRRVGERR